MVTKKIKNNKVSEAPKRPVSSEMVTEKKIKTKRRKLESEALKNAVFEELAYGASLDEVAEKFGYSRTHIFNVSKQIDDEFLLEVTGSDRNKKIAKQIRRLEAITKTLYTELRKADTVRDKVSLQGQILKTMEYVAKLQGLLVNVIETNDKTDKADTFLSKF